MCSLGNLLVLGFEVEGFRDDGTQWEVAVVGLIIDYVAVSRSAGPTRGVWHRFLQMGRALEDLGEK